MCSYDVHVRNFFLVDVLVHYLSVVNVHVRHLSIAEIRTTSIYYQGPDPGIEFVVDQASVEEIHTDSGWHAKTDTIINNIRKSDINFRSVRVTREDLCCAFCQTLMLNSTIFLFCTAVLYSVELLSCSM